MIGPWARSRAGEPPPGGESCVKTMRPRSSSVRSQRLFKASSACSRHASVQVGSWDRRSRVLGQWFVLVSPVGTRGLWRALAGGSSKQVSLRSLARHWGGSGWSRRLLPLRAVRAAPAAFVPASCMVLDRRCWQSRARRSVRPRLTDQPRVCGQPFMAAPSISRTPLGRMLFQSFRASKGCLRFIIQ